MKKRGFFFKIKKNGAFLVLGCGLLNRTRSIASLHSRCLTPPYSVGKSVSRPAGRAGVISPVRPFYSSSSSCFLVPCSGFCRLSVKFSCWCLWDNQFGNEIFDVVDSWRVEAEVVRILCFWVILFVLCLIVIIFIYFVGSCSNYGGVFSIELN